MTTFLYVTSPDCEPERVSELGEPDFWWSTHSEAKAGDTAIVYVNGKGISHVWRILGDAFRAPEWHYAAAVGHEFDLKSPLTMLELLEKFSLDEFPALKQRLRGFRAIKLKDKIERKLLELCKSRRQSKTVVKKVSNKTKKPNKRR
jgi:hypothetical protein